MRNSALMAMLPALLTTTVVVGQGPNSGPATVSANVVAPLVIGAKSPNVLLENTEIPLRTMTELSSKKNKVGDRFDLEVVDDINLNNRTVIPAGTRAVGEVTKVIKKGMFGKSGKLETRVLYVRLGDKQIRVKGENADRGKGGTAATVASLIFIWPAAFFVTGKSAVLPPGTQTTTYLENDLPVIFADDTQPTAVVVPPVAAIVR